MTTWTLTGRESLLSVLGSRLRQLTLPARAVLLVVARLLLTVAGLACIVVAAWLVAVPLGLLCAGVSLLLLEWVVKR